MKSIKKGEKSKKNKSGEMKILIKRKMHKKNTERKKIKEGIREIRLSN